jgi:para-nitrobenzyl esterase
MIRVCITLVAALCATAVNPQAAPVMTDAGAVEGVAEGEIVAYKGIPFAAPPVGDFRWREPQPVAPWTGVRNADHFSPVCVQRGIYPDDAPPEPMSEDCLYLNVWTAAGTGQGVRLPVMVWIYGGGLVNGTASTPLYDGAALARRGVIVVTANYRLGALGFLAHPDLTRESSNHLSGNYGLLDQLAALKWIQRNIAAFGGDPANVTVFGQSSGAISISILTVSPLARGLFRRAIAQSGGLFEPIEIAPEVFAGSRGGGGDRVRGQTWRAVD